MAIKIFCDWCDVELGTTDTPVTLKLETPRLSLLSAQLCRTCAEKIRQLLPKSE